MKYDLAGQVFSRLTVLALAGTRSNGGNSRLHLWRCVCSCGNEHLVTGTSLRRGKVKSCGCLAKEIKRTMHLKHGHTSSSGYMSKTYRSWYSALQRCKNPHNADYPNYGGRGITFCERWLDFRLFLKDLGECPSNFTLDRIDVNGNYEPENCRWADSITQAYNKRTSIRLSYKGETLTLREWATKTGLPAKNLASRHRRGWPVSKTLSRPLNKKLKQPKP